MKCVIMIHDITMCDGGTQRVLDIKTIKLTLYSDTMHCQTLRIDIRLGGTELHVSLGNCNARFGVSYVVWPNCGLS